ncbi:feruloyl-CoA ortho-hydroxylase [Ketogulonicigenium robustum]|uniref:2-oxoglutarate-dependent ethylene/succinate-forming enzyme n=1 Tax=Ketogulonicigenium robustum TaxID=92947 RepID=A0A1W6P0X6_9RHOB|nr:2-oxoglutarate and iron-dependent oxygenase domain-containing protein [Ketogulonicigenium robustum]ARO15166.1 feruloyl-CoA ortho-hydroxylase [Ketogulonicigenium robustum]
MSQFPSFDLAAFESATGDDRRARAAEIDRICRETGFLILRGHGVAPDVIDAVWTAAQAFFAQSPADKAKVKAPYPGYPYGWLGPNAEALAKSKGEDTPPDLKESFNGGPLSMPENAPPEAVKFCYSPTLWPDMPAFRPAWQAYYAALEDLAKRVMSAFAEALDLAPDYFDQFLQHPVSALRALNYPATTGVTALAAQQRAGAHTDYGSLTILLPQAGSRGLEIFHPSGSWVEVPAEPGVFVINIGDLMARWTADRWVSTLHRVVVIPNQPARQSLAFFHQPDWQATITPLDGSDAYPPVESGPYLMGKFTATQ